MFKVLSDRELIEKLQIKKTDRVLDLGGSAKQHTEIHIDTIADISRPEKVDYTPSQLKATNFVQVDITKDKLPFKDKEFDVVLCTHTLEDLTNPVIAIEEMSRVGKRGYIATPARGQDMVFTHYNIAEWNIGAVREPGHAHHKWFFENRADSMYIVPKNYPILYARDFHYVSWSGPDEFRLFWKGKIKYELYFPLSHHKLIEEYKKFVKVNAKFLRKGLVAIYFDNPYYVVKEIIKKLLRRGTAFQKTYSFKE